MPVASRYEPKADPGLPRFIGRPRSIKDARGQIRTAATFVVLLGVLQLFSAVHAPLWGLSTGVLVLTVSAWLLFSGSEAAAWTCALVSASAATLGLRTMLDEQVTPPIGYTIVSSMAAMLCLQAVRASRWVAGKQGAAR